MADLMRPCPAERGWLGIPAGLHDLAVRGDRGLPAWRGEELHDLVMVEPSTMANR